MNHFDHSWAGRRFTTALAVAASVIACLGFGGTLAGGSTGAAPQQTDASWVTEETGALTAAAGTVHPAVTSCVGQNSAPNLLHLAPAAEGLDVAGYLVTIEVGDGDDAGGDADPVPDAWQSGATSAGEPFLPANTPTYVPTSTPTIAWGISSGYAYTWTGTVTVEAVGPGGWTSESVSHDWSIGFGLFGEGYGSCS